MKKFFYFLLLLLLSACSSHNNVQGDAQTLIVEAKPSVTTLYFSGVIEPSSQRAIVSKVDGSIKKMYFKYDTAVAKDQLLFVIETPQLVSDYQSALSDYLKAQYQYTVDTKKLQGSTELKKMGIISEQEYQTDQSTHYTDILSLSQAKQKLNQTLAKFDKPPISLQQLSQFSATDLDQLSAKLAQSKTTLEVYAPVTGIAMPGEKSGDSGSTNSNLTIGSAIKAGQALVNIGERTGIAVSIKVSEISIDSIPTEQAVVVTGDGFPNITLHGEILYKERLPVNSDSSGGGTPQYLVHIIIPQITLLQREIIRLGMSAQVAIPITQPPAIKIPLSAVLTKNDQTFVKRIDPKTDEPVDTPVVTGATTEDAVTIQSGLKPGDKIIIHANDNAGN